MTTPDELPLFPLQAVLFPGGLLGLKVFEARYLDLISSCLRGRQPFGVVALRSGHEVRAADTDAVSFEPVGTLAELIDADSDVPGILEVSCRGTQRFRVLSSRQRKEDGLWLATTEPLPDDVALVPTEALSGAAQGLADAIKALKARQSEPFLQPYRLNDAGWVANRWCEILPIPQAAKYKLMELEDPIARLQLVDDYLRSKGVLTG